MHSARRIDSGSMAEQVINWWVEKHWQIDSGTLKTACKGWYSNQQPDRLALLALLALPAVYFRVGICIFLPWQRQCGLEKQRKLFAIYLPKLNSHRCYAPLFHSIESSRLSILFITLSQYEPKNEMRRQSDLWFFKRCWRGFHLTIFLPQSPQSSVAFCFIDHADRRMHW